MRNEARYCKSCFGCGLAYPLTHRYAITEKGKWFHAKSCCNRYFARERKEQNFDKKIGQLLIKHGFPNIEEMLKAVDNMTHEDCQNFIKATTKRSF